jgi:hypothetical protein
VQAISVNQQITDAAVGSAKNSPATLVNTRQSEYILGKINANGDNIHGLPLSNE